jgi:hypothetical protein
VAELRGLTVREVLGLDGARAEDTEDRAEDTEDNETTA